MATTALSLQKSNSHNTTGGIRTTTTTTTGAVRTRSSPIVHHKQRPKRILIQYHVSSSSSRHSKSNQILPLTTTTTSKSTEDDSCCEPEGFSRRMRRKATLAMQNIRKRWQPKPQMPQPYIDRHDISYDVEVDEAVTPTNRQVMSEELYSEYNYDDDYDDEDDNSSSAYYDDDDEEDAANYSPVKASKSSATKTAPLTPVTLQRESSVSNESDEDSAAAESQFYWETVGEVLDDKYRVVDVLGKGTFGRVVECYEVNPNHWKEWLGIGAWSRGVLKKKTSGLYAIKIVRTKYTSDAKEEAAVLKLVNTAAELDVRGTRYFPILYEEFTLPSRHYCLVMEKLGQSLLDVMQSNDDFTPFNLPTVKSIAIQLFDALDYLHSVCHIVHTDLKPENLLFTASNHRQQYDTRIKLIDLGSAMLDKDPHKASIINTKQYRAPEVLLETNDWSYPSDVWVAACVLFELRTGRYLFDPQNREDHLQLLQQKIGKFPKRMVTKSTIRDDFEIPFLTGSCSFKQSSSCDTTNTSKSSNSQDDAETDENDTTNHTATTTEDQATAATAAMTTSTTTAALKTESGTLKEELGDFYHDGFYKLLSSCLQLSPRARPKAKKAMQLAKKIELDLSPQLNHNATECYTEPLSGSSSTSSNSSYDSRRK